MSAVDTAGAPDKPDLLLPAPTIGVIPKAHYSCTDLANANRLRSNYGQGLLVHGGAFYVYNGKYWERDESAAHRMAATLSMLTRGEAAGLQEELDALREKMSAETAEKFADVQRRVRPEYSKSHKDLQQREDGVLAEELRGRIQGLKEWALRCEMSSVQDAALRLLRKMLTIAPEKLDANKRLLNCPNGTIDLQTGELRAHDPADYITMLAPTEYRQDAAAPRFERFVDEIMSGERERVDFLQRWFGYCCTGETKEQVFVLQVGAGRNGKSLQANIFESVLGSSAAGGYLYAVASSLLASDRSGERHPTEQADLVGKRFGMAAETEEGAHLRESLIKLIVGEDTIRARFMHKDLFEFRPQIKLNLRTNRKPVVRGQEFAIWARILLVEYRERFGTREEIDSGKATHLRDNDLLPALLAEREGILAWLVRGAVEWYRTGLRAPESVLAASRAYQSEEDRVSEFVQTRCVLDPKSWSPIVGERGLYPAYTEFARESGYTPLGKRRFIEDMARAVPRFKSEERCIQGAVGSWKTQTGSYGVLVLRDNDFFRPAGIDAETIARAKAWGCDDLL